MLKLNDLDGFKLVNINYLATNDEVTAALKDAFEQGSQGWGVRPEVAVFLSLVSQLRVQITLADVADEAQRQLKGEQMGHGRTKKQLVEAKQELVEATSEAILAIDDKDKALGACAEERDELAKANEILTTAKRDSLTDPE